MLETPGRSIPWVDDSINYRFSGGLEPGETQELELASNMFSEWSKKGLKDRKDLMLTLEVVNLVGPDGQEIVDSSMEEIERNKQRLERLKNQLVDVNKKIKGGA